MSLGRPGTVWSERKHVIELLFKIMLIKKNNEIYNNPSLSLASQTISPGPTHR